MGLGRRGERKRELRRVLEGPGNGLDMVNKTVKSKMTEGNLHDRVVATTIDRK